MQRIPKFLYQLKEQADSESDPKYRVEKSLCFVEAILKYHTVFIVADYLSTIDSKSHEEDDSILILSKGILSSSLSIWTFITENLLSIVPWERRFLPEFEKYFAFEFRDISMQFLELHRKIHPDTLSDLEMGLSLSKDILDLAKKITQNSPIFQCNLRPGVLLERNTNSYELVLEKADRTCLKLGYLLILQSSYGESKVYFFNEFVGSQKIKKLGRFYLETGDLYRGTDESFFQEFKKNFQTKSIDYGLPFRFRNLMNNFILNFQGREVEEVKLLKYIVNNDCGSILVMGEPGIGKSSFLSTISKTIRQHMEDRKHTGIQFKLPSEMNFIVLEYFFDRGLRDTNINDFYKFLGVELNRIFNIKDIPIGGDLREREFLWLERIKRVSSMIENPTQKSHSTKLILIIDAIDSSGPEILRFIRNNKFRGVIFLCSSSGKYLNKIRSWCSTIFEYELKSLPNRDRASLFQRIKNHTGKKNEPAISKSLIDLEIEKFLLKKELGNPLYICLILKTPFKISDLDRIPQDLNSLFGFILKQISSSENSHISLSILDFLVLTKEPVELCTITYFLGYGVEELESGLEKIRLLLNTEKNSEFGFYLSHESIREYVFTVRKKEVEEMQRNILEHILDWVKNMDISDISTTNYLMKFGITILLEGVGQRNKNFEIDFESTENFEYRKMAESILLNSDYHEKQRGYLGTYSRAISDGLHALKRIIIELTGNTGSKGSKTKIFKQKETGEKFRTTTLLEFVAYIGEIYRKDSIISVLNNPKSRDNRIFNVKSFADLITSYNSYLENALFLLNIRSKNRMVDYTRVAKYNLQFLKNSRNSFLHTPEKFNSNFYFYILEKYIKSSYINFDLKYKIILHNLRNINYYLNSPERLRSLYRLSEISLNLKAPILKGRIIIIIYISLISSDLESSYIIYLYRLGKFMGNAGYTKRARKIFLEVLEELKKTGDSGEKYILLNKILDNFSEIDLELRKSFLSDLIGIAKSLSGFYRRIEILLKISEIYSINEYKIEKAQIYRLLISLVSVPEDEICKRYEYLPIISKTAIRNGDLEFGVCLFLECIEMLNELIIYPSFLSILENILLTARYIPISLIDVNLLSILFSYIEKIENIREQSHILLVFGETCFVLEDIIFAFDVISKLKYSAYRMKKFDYYLKYFEIFNIWVSMYSIKKKYNHLKIWAIDKVFRLSDVQKIRYNCNLIEAGYLIKNEIKFEYSSIRTAALLEVIKSISNLKNGDFISEISEILSVSSGLEKKEDRKKVLSQICKYIVTSVDLRNFIYFETELETEVFEPGVLTSLLDTFRNLDYAEQSCEDLLGFYLRTLLWSAREWKDYPGSIFHCIGLFFRLGMEEEALEAMEVLGIVPAS